MSVYTYDCYSSITKIFQGDICGSGVKYPLIGAIREELLGIPRDVIAPGIEPADIDWESVSTALAPVQATTLPSATRIDINSVRQPFVSLSWHIFISHNFNLPLFRLV